MKIKKAKTDKQRKKLEQKYIDYRQFLNTIIKTKRRQFEKQRFDKHKNDSKFIWQNINSVLGGTNNKRDAPKQINDENGMTLSNLNDIVNGFN